MRIREIAVSAVPPIRCFRTNTLSDVVVLAGANGVGKTRLVETLIQNFSSLNNPNVRLAIEATDPEESEQWHKATLDTSNRADAEVLRQTLQQNRRRRNFRSSVLYFESNRSIQQVKPFAFSWDMPDPWEENISWNYALTGLRNRFQDTLHAIFRKIQNQRNSIAIRAQQLRKQGFVQMNLDFEDPVTPFREAFTQLLAPKVLEDADLKNQTLRYSINGATFDIKTLSSGEQEVLNITFDFILRWPLHCIVFFDEPELHLHPELSSKLINTLKTVGESNQFIFCSHSPDIISSCLDDSVIIVGPDRGEDTNQAIEVKPEDETNEALRSLGHSIGIVALGKKIVLIEGTAASLDKQTYGHILRNRFPGLVLVPSAGKHTIFSFETIVSHVLERTMWGVDFMMLCDRDAVPFGSDPRKLRDNSKGRFRVLPRYHLENYFLDEAILAEIFAEMEPNGSWLTDPEKIRGSIREIAKSRVSYATALMVTKHFREKVGNLNLMPKGCHGMTCTELKEGLAAELAREQARFATAISAVEVDALTERTFSRLYESIEKDDGVWVCEIPGKQVFAMFCSRANIEPGRLKTMYIRSVLSRNDGAFDEIIGIFEDLSKVCDGG